MTSFLINLNEAINNLSIISMLIYVSIFMNLNYRQSNLTCQLKIIKFNMSIENNYVNNINKKT